MHVTLRAAKLPQNRDCSWYYTCSKLDRGALLYRSGPVLSRASTQIFRPTRRSRSNTHGPAARHIRQFIDAARSGKQLTDKVMKHGYQTMYGRFLVPLAQSSRRVRLFEVGLGCNMDYGAGASIALWRSLLPNATLFSADVDRRCVEKHRAAIRAAGAHALEGDEGRG